MPKIVKDSREQKGWDFPDQIIECLPEGDYALKDFPQSVVIERKGCVAEFAQNLCQERFLRELKRLRSYDHAYVFLEFEVCDLLDYPACLPAPIRKRIRLKGAALLKKFLEVALEFPHIHFLFVGSEGKRVAASLFKRIIENRKSSQILKGNFNLEISIS